MRYQLMIGSARTGEPAAAGSGSKFQRFKAGMLAFLALCATIGVLLAALVLGSVLAIVILIVVIVAVLAWLVLRLWDHRPPKSKAQP